MGSRAVPPRSSFSKTVPSPSRSPTALASKTSSATCGAAKRGPARTPDRVARYAVVLDACVLVPVRCSGSPSAGFTARYGLPRSVPRLLTPAHRSTHSKASNIRKDTIRKASYRAATTYAINVVEDLNVGGMGRRGQGKRGFNDAVHDAALGEFRRQLTYKCSWHGSELWVADRWYPSSKLCSRCRMRNAGLLRSARVFRCERCGLVIDRDLNAAKNLAALTEFACVCLMAQLMTGEPVDWSSLPIRPSGWGPDKDTRSSRGSARAGGRKADGGERKTAQHSSAGDRSFHREVAVATGPVASLGGVSHSPKKAVV